MFDGETLGLIRYVLAMGRFRDYSVGPVGLEAQLCGLAFERMLVQTARRFDKFQNDAAGELKLVDVVKFLRKKNLVDSAVACELSEYLGFYGLLLRGGRDVSVERAGFMGQAILRFLCVHAGLDLDREVSRVGFGDLVARKTVSGGGVLEVVEGDFDCLDRLYVKCPSIQSEILKRVKVPLKAGAVSVFAPNSGGIWVPFVTEKAVGGLLDGGVSLGVGFSPLGVRVGLGFGEFAHRCRVRYYELLLKGELVEMLEMLSLRGAGYCFCDTYWHYHVRNVESLQWGITLYGSTKLALEREIEVTKRLGDQALCGHRYLVSKVIVRRPEDFTYVVGGLVDEAVRVLDELYGVLALIDGV